MSNASPQVLIAGSLTRDRISFQGSQIGRPGGVVWYAASTMTDLGLSVRVLTRTTPEDRVLLDPLIEAGVDVVWEPSSSTTTLSLNYEPGNPSRREIRVESLADAINGRYVAEALEGIRLLYLGPIHAGDFDRDCLGVIRRLAPRRIALDAQGFLRRQKNGLLVSGRPAVLADWLAVTGVLKVSEKEGRTLLNDAAIPRESMAPALASRLDVPETLVTCGVEGAWIWHDGAPSHVRARRVAADPTGAGDLFFAAYLSRRETGDPGEAAADFAAAFVENVLADRAARAR